jgi:hypothetical protein
VNDSSLSDFDIITNNVWQEPQTFYPTANGGINWVGTSASTANYETPAAWNAQSKVGTDYFSNTPINSSDQPGPGTLAGYVGTPIIGVFTNIYGWLRAATGSWTAGAV